MGRSRPEPGVRRNVDYQGEGGRRWVANMFRVSAGAFNQLRVIGFDGPPENLRIGYRIDAERAQYITDGDWRFENGTIRYFPEGSRQEEVIRFESMTLKGLAERPEDFVIETQDPQQMTFAELRDEIRNLEPSLT